MNAEPGTGTQYYVEATMDPRNDPNFDDDVDVSEAQRYHVPGRTWVCGRDYLDTEARDVAMLESVVRKSAWCSTKEPEEAPVYLRFDLQRAGELEYQLRRPYENALQRFIERYRDPVNRGP